MTRQDPSPKPKAPSPDSREARLKAALKANIGRRKLQARERAAQEGDEDEAHLEGAPGQTGLGQTDRGQAEKD